MKLILIYVHSLVDLITNSSTETYIGVSEKAVIYVIKVINDILEVAGSDKTANELFDISVCSFDPDCNSGCWFDDYLTDNHIKPIDHDHYTEIYSNIPPETKIKSMKVYCNNCETSSTILSIKPKIKSNIDDNIGKMISKIFKLSERVC